MPGLSYPENQCREWGPLTGQFVFIQTMKSVLLQTKTCVCSHCCDSTEATEIVELYFRKLACVLCFPSSKLSSKVKEELQKEFYKFSAEFWYWNGTLDAARSLCYKLSLWQFSLLSVGSTGQGWHQSDQLFLSPFGAHYLNCVICYSLPTLIPLCHLLFSFLKERFILGNSPLN